MVNPIPAEEEVPAKAETEIEKELDQTKIEELAKPEEPTPPDNSSSFQVEPENEVQPSVGQRLGGYFNRFRRSSNPPPSLPPTLPEIIEPSEPTPELKNSDETELVPSTESKN